MVAEAKTFMVEDGQIIFRNFTGKEGPYNREGDRNFAVILDNESAEKMLADGWNVKYTKPRDDDAEVGDPYITVAVNFKNRPPRVVLITSSGRTNLNEDTVALLDWADIQVADLIATGYVWNVGEKSGMKAYLQSLFVTINEDALEIKYGANTGG